MKTETKRPRIVILTGAGISAESGISTFRDAGGLWENHRIEDVATPEGFARDPGLVQRFYNLRRQQLAFVQPNAAHHALARLAAAMPGEVLIVTQNVDDLHDRASLLGGQEVLHMHGALKQKRCLRTGAVSACEGDIGPDDGHRPHIVWFGEMPLQMDRIEAALQGCETFAAIGTSGQVYPAAGFVQIARAFGAETVELNLEPSGLSGFFSRSDYGPATEVVERWVDYIKARC